MSEKDDEARARRQRLLRRAFGNLGTMPNTPSPAPEGARPAAPAPVTAPQPPPPRPAAAPAPQSPPADSAADQEYSRKVEEKAALLGRDHFAVLGVPRTATKEQIKAAYLQAVKAFHPDHIPPSLVARLEGKVRDIFNAVRDAHTTLEDDTRRGLYLASLQKPVAASGAAGASAAAAGDAATLEKQAELHMRKREYALAAEQFAKAFAISKHPSHLAQEAWAIYVDPRRKVDLPLAIRKLEEALATDPRNDKACYALGVIARVDGDLQKATRLFKTAVATNPRNAEAATELRLMELRAKKR